jgi:hypothetical protein
MPMAKFPVKKPNESLFYPAGAKQIKEKATIARIKAFVQLWQIWSGFSSSDSDRILLPHP